MTDKNHNKAPATIRVDSSDLLAGFEEWRVYNKGSAGYKAQKGAWGAATQMERARIKKVIEGVIIPVAHEMIKCYGMDHQHFIDINEMWIDLFDEQLFPSENTETRRS